MAVTIKTILSCLESTDPAMRVRAVSLLVRSRDKRALPFLERAASEDESPQVRYYARKGIQYLLRCAETGEQADGAAPPPQKPHPAPSVDITTLAPSQVEQNLAHPEQWTRLQTVRAIDEYRASEYVPHLISRLGVEGNRQVLSALLLTIGRIGGEAAAEAIIPFLQNDDSRVRANAIEALDAVGDQASYVYLIPFLRDPDNRCRANAVLALRKYGRVNVFKTLEGMLLSKEVWMQDSATYVLGRMGSGNRVFDLLNLALSSDFLVVRKQARQVLERLAERGVDRAQSLLERLDDEDTRPGEEELFERLENLSAIRAEMAADGQEPREQRAKTPEEALSALARLSAEAPEDTSDGPTQRLEQRAEAALTALKSLSGPPGEKASQVVPQSWRRKRPVRLPEQSQFSGAFEPITLDDDENNGKDEKDPE